MITRFARLVTALSIFDYRHHAMIPSPRVLTIPGAVTQPLHPFRTRIQRTLQRCSVLLYSRPFLTELSYAFVIIARLAGSMCRLDSRTFCRLNASAHYPSMLFMMQQSENIQPHSCLPPPNKPFPEVDNTTYFVFVHEPTYGKFQNLSFFNLLHYMRSTKSTLFGFSIKTFIGIVVRL